MGHKKRGKSAKKARAAQIASDEPDSLKKAPHSFIFHRGTVGKNCMELVRDLRRVMEPYTATKLKAARKNQLRDFVSIAGPLGVTHFMIVSKNEQHVNMRLIRLPHGPTLTFRVNSYCLARDVICSLKRPIVNEKQLNHHPLLVQNNLKQDKDGPKHLQLVQNVIQNMFPPLNINNLDLNDVRRCALFNYEKDTDQITFRHYTIKAVPSGVSKSAKKLVQKKLPDLGKYKDMSEFFTNPGELSESEYELEAGTNEVTLNQDLSTRGCHNKSTVAVRLMELGPRLTMELIKIEAGMNKGDVLYHKYIKISSKDAKKRRKKILTNNKLKVSRKREQEDNVEKKKLAKREHKVKCLAGIPATQEETAPQEDTVVEENSATHKETAALTQNGHATLKKKRKLEKKSDGETTSPVKKKRRAKENQ